LSVILEGGVQDSSREQAIGLTAENIPAAKYSAIFARDIQQEKMGSFS
jgi:hypothetical protein